MNDQDLRQAIEDVNKLTRTTSPDAPLYWDFVKHLRVLMAEQERRATTPIKEQQ